MKNRNFGMLCKNAMGTVFLLAGAFFVCSTLVSMRAVFADPIAPTVTPVAGAASPRGGTTGRAATTRAASTARGANTARTTASPSRVVTSRGVTTGASASRATNAVSNTHIRAHDTSQDMVLRVMG